MPNRELTSIMRRSRPIYLFRRKEPIGMNSELESKLLTLFEFFSHVQSVIRAPFPEDMEEYGLSTDTQLLVTFRTGNYSHRSKCWRPWLVEADEQDKWKPREPDRSERRRQSDLEATKRGWIYKLVIQSDIHQQTFENITALNHYRAMVFDPADRLEVVRRLRHKPILQVEDLVHDLTAAADPRVGTAHIWHLLATGVICCDIRRPLNGLTEVWLANDE